MKQKELTKTYNDNFKLKKPHFALYGFYKSIADVIFYHFRKQMSVCCMSLINPEYPVLEVINPRSPSLHIVRFMAFLA